jgi:hypothetical protein
MLVEKELQERQQKNQINISNNLNQVLARMKQVFAKIKTAISRRVVATTDATATSLPPPCTTI